MKHVRPSRASTPSPSNANRFASVSEPWFRNSRNKRELATCLARALWFLHSADIAWESRGQELRKGLSGSNGSNGRSLFFSRSPDTEYTLHRTGQELSADSAKMAARHLRAMDPMKIWPWAPPPSSLPRRNFGMNMWACNDDDHLMQGFNKLPRSSRGTDTAANIPNAT